MDADERTSLEYALKVIVAHLLHSGNDYMEGACLVDGRMLKVRIQFKEIIE